MFIQYVHCDALHRADRIAAAVLSIADSLVCILSFGFLSSGLSLLYISNATRRRLQRQMNNNNNNGA